MELPGENLVLKLWETLVEKGIGSLLSPWQAGREGRARNEVRRQEILMLAQAEADAVDIRAGRKQFRPDGTLLLDNSQDPHYKTGNGRIEPTLTLSSAVDRGTRAAAVAAARSEINATKAIIFAEDQLASDSQAAPAKEVDEDWLFVWREYAGKVSSEDLQRLWGSVLAGEVKSPGSYSIRTLEFLKTLSKPEAELISKLAKYVIDGKIVRSQGKYLESKGFPFYMLMRLQELGVISGVESVGLKASYKSSFEGVFLRALVSHSKVLIVEHNNAHMILSFETYALTTVGREILALGAFEPDEEYMRLVGKDFLKSGFKVKLADWRADSETHGHYVNAEDVVADESAAQA